MNKASTAVALLALVLATPVSAGETFHTATRSGLNLYFGDDIAITEPANNAIVAAAGKIDITGLHAGEIFAAGGDVHLSAVDTDRAVLGAGKLALGGTFHNGIIAGAGELTLAPGTIIGSDAVLVGGKVVIDATIGGDLIASGGNVRLAGHVTGDAQLRAREIAIAPGSVIDGDLVYASPTAFEVPADITIKGKITREDWNRRNMRVADDVGYLKSIATAAGIALAVLALAAIALVGGLIWFIWYLLSEPRHPSA